ncbi:MAG: hypothetical protein HN350_05335 [Phycisphaerales bacterium]|jgi:hypothetical protein|nr:hypothetical protein [Phycisphaerales bacterium]
MTEVNEFDEDQDILDDEYEDDEEAYVPAFEVSCAAPKSGGANFRTMKLTAPSPDQVVFTRTLGLMLFAGVFMAAGVFIGIMGISFCLEEATSANIILPQIFFLVFGGAGYFIWRLTRSITFDKIAGCFWRHKRRGQDGQDNAIALEKIDCLQVTCKYTSSSDGPGYHAYALHVVLNDPPGERVRIMSHAKIDPFWQDTWALSEFLEKPIWDCTDYE